VGVTEETKAATEPFTHEGDILAGGFGGKDILIGIAGRPVDKHRRPIECPTVGQFRQEIRMCLAEDTPGPEDGLSRQGVEIIGLFEPGRHAVMVAHDTGDQPFADDLDTLVRPGIIPDDIAQAEYPVYSQPFERIQAGLETDKVRVDIR
jgi:hypothetical protein